MVTQRFFVIPLEKCLWIIEDLAILMVLRAYDAGGGGGVND